MVGGLPSGPDAVRTAVVGDARFGAYARSGQDNNPIGILQQIAQNSDLLIRWLGAEESNIRSVKCDDFHARTCVRTLGLLELGSNTPACRTSFQFRGADRWIAVAPHRIELFDRNQSSGSGSGAMLLTDCGIDQLELWRNRIARPVQRNRARSASRFDRIVSSGLGIRRIRPGLGGCQGAIPNPICCGFAHRCAVARPPSDLARHEQRARVLAFRGLSQARDGEYERAQTTFASAARLDPRLDLALLPSFWALPRRAHDAAIAALHDAGRRRDAAALTATVKTRFRPRALRAINRANDQSGNAKRVAANDSKGETGLGADQLGNRDLRTAWAIQQRMKFCRIRWMPDIRASSSGHCIFWAPTRRPSAIA